MGKLVDIDDVKKAIDKAIKERWAGREYVGLPVHDEYIVEGLEEAKNALSELENKEEKKPNIVDQLRHHLATTPKEQLDKEWKDLEKWGNVGPTVSEFLGWSRPEMGSDFDKEFIRVLHGKDKEVSERGDTTYSQEDLEDIARYFYLLGRKSGEAHSNACAICTEFKRGYDSGKANGFAQGYNKGNVELLKTSVWATVERKSPSWNNYDFRLDLPENVTFKEGDNVKIIILPNGK